MTHNYEEKENLERSIEEITIGDYVSVPLRIRVHFEEFLQREKQGES